ncbi:MAG: multiheme c-type cytochrome [Kiloniellales bacterium]|nr:multiheme c-type cytochrome [Kiloniellales bacterium]
MSSQLPPKPKFLALTIAFTICATVAWPAVGSERGEPVEAPRAEAPEVEAETLAEAVEAAPAEAGPGAEEEEAFFDEAERQHELLFQETRYPSAATCGTCHPKHYKEWSVSQHSYAQLSPVYMAINNFLNFSTSSSMGDFCLRCHNQVGANLGESPFISNLERHPTSREGITCVVCHRVNKAYNKASGRIGLQEGDLLEPVYGPTGNSELERVLKDDDYRVVTEREQQGRQIHTQVKKFAGISSSTFCGSCHDVTLFNGFRLEEAFSEYRMSPAAARGETCQDCHMGKVQGVASGYAHGPAAEVGGVETKPRKLTDHTFAGPDYSVIHPGIFPHNSDAQKLATLEDWLKFDVEAGWGTDAFEDTVSDDQVFPERWEAPDDRYDAREILDVQFARLATARKKRLELLRNGYMLGDIVIEDADSDGLDFSVEVKNITDGHNVPTGFTGERLVWLEVTVFDAEGKVLFQSGDRDPNGDVRDLHSLYVHNGELPLDDYLFNLQSRFVVTQGRGGEREAVIPIPFTVTALPIVRPSTLSLILTGEPPTERNHRKGIEPLGNRWADYSVDGDALTGKGPYRATVKLNAQMIPVNLIAAVERVGFDYNMSARELADAVVAGAETLWEKEIVFEVDG